jgi:hypothetical protein
LPKAPGMVVMNPANLQAQVFTLSKVHQGNNTTNHKVIKLGQKVHIKVIQRVLDIKNRPYNKSGSFINTLGNLGLYYQLKLSITPAVAEGYFARLKSALRLTSPTRKFKPAVILLVFLPSASKRIRRYSGASVSDELVTYL